MRHRSMKTLLLASVFLAGPALADLQITQGWFRAVPPVSPSMAGYMTLTNDGETPIVITGATSPVAGHAMLHDVKENDDGSHAMAHLDQLTLEPGQSDTLAPGGKHLMLMELDAVPDAGEKVDVCLTLKQGQPACASLPVQRQAPH